MPNEAGKEELFLDAMSELKEISFNGCYFDEVIQHCQVSDNYEDVKSKTIPLNSQLNTDIY